jgi:hypothetical protein
MNSDVLETSLLTALAFTTEHMAPKWHSLYSADRDGRSMNRLEWSLLGYTEPTVLVIRTTAGAVLRRRNRGKSRDSFMGTTRMAFYFN